LHFDHGLKLCVLRDLEKGDSAYFKVREVKLCTFSALKKSTKHLNILEKLQKTNRKTEFFALNIGEKWIYKNLFGLHE